MDRGVHQSRPNQEFLSPRFQSIFAQSTPTPLGPRAIVKPDGDLRPPRRSQNSFLLARMRCNYGGTELPVRALKLNGDQLYVWRRPENRRFGPITRGGERIAVMSAPWIAESQALNRQLIC